MIFLLSVIVAHPLFLRASAPPVHHELTGNWHAISTLRQSTFSITNVHKPKDLPNDFGVLKRMPKAKKLTVECYRSLDISRLAKAGSLAVGVWSVYSWHQSGRQTSAIGVIASCIDSLTLEYRLRGELRKVHIGLDYTRCHFGGRRAWFLCPVQGCGRRVAKLYGSSFRCRDCLYLAYDSQSESESLRSVGRSMALRKKLKLHDAYFWLPAASVPRPKGMHDKTYQRLMEQLQDAERGVRRL